MKCELIAPDTYWATRPELLAEICNGVGPESWPAWIRQAMDSPAFCWGISLKPAANIHDYMYWLGRTEAHKIEADDVFRQNEIRLVWAYTRWYEYPLLPLRFNRTKQLYLAVKYGGGPAFWAGKDKPNGRTDHS